MGTDWANPFQLVARLSPKPDVIYFMTDGTPDVDNHEQVLASVRKWNYSYGRPIPINTIAVGHPSVATYLQQMANESHGGQYTVLESAATPPPPSE
jgi:hypothetical protein